MCLSVSLTHCLMKDLQIGLDSIAYRLNLKVLHKGAYINMTTINGEMFLSKVVTENDVKALSRHGLYASHFQTNIEKRAYDFILDFARSNEGNAPSYATLIDAVPEFDYYPDATDSFTFYGKQLKTSKYQNEMAEFFNGDSSQFAKAWAEYSKEPEKFYQVLRFWLVV